MDTYFFKNLNHIESHGIQIADVMVCKLKTGRIVILD